MQVFSNWFFLILKNLNIIIDIVLHLISMQVCFGFNIKMNFNFNLILFLIKNFNNAP
jgi:hypothetical protein